MNIRKHQEDMFLTALLGPSFSNLEIKKLLEQSRINYVEDKNIEKTVANLINKNKTVGWFQSRGEYGKRSLGCRSILADPRKLESKSRINQLLKKRDWFMPYAPSILEEYVDIILLKSQVNHHICRLRLRLKKTKIK